MKRLNSRLEEISDTESDEQDGDDLPSSEDDDEGDEQASDGRQTIASIERIDKRTPAERAEEQKREELLEAAITNAMNETSAGLKDKPPASPPPSYEVATNFPLPSSSSPNAQHDSSFRSTASAERTKDDHIDQRPMRLAQKSYNPTSSPSPNVAKAKPDNTLPSPSDVLHNVIKHAPPQVLEQVAPDVLERIPSSGSESSLYRAFRDAAHPDASSSRRPIARTRRTTYNNGTREEEVQEESNDPNVFYMDIPDPPSPGSRRRNSIAVPGGRAGTGKDKGKGKMRVKRKGKSGRRSSAGLIRIVDRSGGAWREMEEMEEQDEDENIDGDDLTRRILGEEITSEKNDVDLEGSGGRRSEDLITNPGSNKPESVAARAVKDRPGIARSASLTRSPTGPRSPLSRPTSPVPPLSRSESSLTPAGGPFARDVRVLGWKIVGGQTKVEQDRSKGVSQGRKSDESVEKKYVEVERGKIGAFVGESNYILWVNLAIVRSTSTGINSI